MNLKRSAAGAIAAAAFTVGAAVAPVMSPAAHPAPAYAQAAGNVTVNLADSVGEDWFARIGDRTVTLERIDGVDPNNGEQLKDLDIPKLKNTEPGKFSAAASARTSNGTASLDVEPGVYLLTVADDTNVTGANADRRVFYSPIVVVVRSGDAAQTVTPKAQVLGINVDPLTACNSPEWREAAAPGTYVEYDFTASVPNLSTDGTIDAYSLELTLSPGHTVLWEPNDPAVMLTAKGPTTPTPLAATQAAPLTAGKGSERVFAAVDKRNVHVLAADRKDEPASKLEAPKLTVRGAGETLNFEENRDYTVKKDGADTATFSLTERGLKELARLRAADAATQVDVWVPVRANDKAPWGGGPVRDVVLGDLAAIARLTTDGMDHDRSPVTVEHINHVNVVKRAACFTESSSSTTSTSVSAPTSSSSSDESTGPTSTVTTTVGAPGDGSASGGNGTAPGGDDSGGSEGSDGGGGIRNLASTGAAVVGVSIAGALLILLGLLLRRRRDDEDDNELNEQRA